MNVLLCTIKVPMYVQNFLNFRLYHYKNVFKTLAYLFHFTSMYLQPSFTNEIYIPIFITKI